MRSFVSADAPQPVAAYSQAIEAGGFVFTAGQLGTDPKTGLMGQGLEAQAELAFSNIAAVLRAAGLQSSDVVKVSIFMTDLTQFSVANAVYARFVGEHRPARTTVGVATLPLGALIEVDVIAARR
jgi:2-iminobutanoate/2-iminopropanoate deaminase